MIDFDDTLHDIYGQNRRIYILDEVLSECYFAVLEKSLVESPFWFLDIVEVVLGNLF